MNLHAAEGAFPHVLSSRTHALLPHCGLANTISPDQIFYQAKVARLLHSDGGTTGNSERRWQADRADCARVKIIVFL
jgi:hypothetical protein